MKKFTIIGFITLLLATACSKDDTGTPKNGSLLLLEVDYVTNTFVGGKEYVYSQTSISTDTVPLKAFYISPCDFGELVVRFEPTRDTIFNGIIRWQHTGEVIVPERVNPSDEFEFLPSSARIKPENSQFQPIYIDQHCYPSSFAEIWDPISRLKATSSYFDSNKKIGIFLYTPSVGYPDDEINRHQEDWRWFIVMYK